MKPNRILICSTCVKQSGEAAAALEIFSVRVAHAIRNAGLGDQFNVSDIACMGACRKPLALAIQGHRRATYLFAGLNPEIEVADIVSTCRTFLDAPSGWIEDARSCGALRECLRSRVPALGVD